MRKVKIAISIILLLAIASLAKAYTPETLPNPRRTEAKAFVANPDGVLSTNEVAALQSICEQIFSVSKAEVCFVAVNSIEGADAADFTVQLFNHWGVGSKERNTGVLVLLARQSRDIHITTGAGIEGILTDYRCSEIIDCGIDELSSNHYGYGLIKMARAMAERLTTNEAQAELLLGFVPKDTSGGGWNLMSLLSAIFGLCYLAVYLSKPRCTKCRQRRLRHIKRTVLELPTYTKQGKGENSYVCEHCGATIILPFTIAMLVHRNNNGGHGGGFYGGFYSGRGHGGGFGGGSFGGGFSLGGGAGRKF